jgi:hypothetical protein
MRSPDVSDKHSGGSTQRLAYDNISQTHCTFSTAQNKLYWASGPGNWRSGLAWGPMEVSKEVCSLAVPKPSGEIVH